MKKSLMVLVISLLCLNVFSAEIVEPSYPIGSEEYEFIVETNYKVIKEYAVAKMMLNY